MELTRGRILDLYEVTLFAAKRYGIQLHGEDSIWPFLFEDKLEYRVSDFEHLLHELAHGIVHGLPDPQDPEYMERWDALSLDDKSDALNEVRVYSVVQRVLRLNGIAGDERAALTCVEDAVRERAPIEEYHTYARTWRGRRNCGTLVKTFNHFVALLNRKRRHKIERLKSRPRSE